ncbi:MAG: D-alanyl-D-alanine carboxypeptidase/D-alanyl-D-alanine-endopeptidase [Propionibacteriaceae bacterium]|jgi:D-alanyl-D-alanine carboxypeptidase/D-alanyl-D-alanine-endopeptidase (penicillin-binding protein 4)|nr:D-alanyl-D-alanine carboxypeptidase/D-alanyl-D-alanine-endopeptidase [Propionibacteriaceae bacterium]
MASQLERLIPRVVVPGAFAAALVALAGWGLTAGTTSGGEPTIDPYRYATPQPTPTPRPPSLAFPEAAQGTLPDPAALTAALNAVARDGAGELAMAVIDPYTGQALVDDRAGAAVTPASNMKLLTAAAALNVLGPDHRFATRLVGVAEGFILVGGGDPSLADLEPADYPARASLQALATAAAAALQAEGSTSILLGYDDSYFAGPGWNDLWEDGDELWATPTSALWADRGIMNGAHSATPAADAGNRFADHLRALGIEVTSVIPLGAPADAPVLAEVQSPPLSVIVQETLRLSDNDMAEVLFRHVGRQGGGDGSLLAAQAAVPVVLQAMGLWADGMAVQDGSGLAYANKVTPSVVAQAVALGFRDPAYRSLLTGLPTAGGDGTLGLAYRYDEPQEHIGRGVVRAKTGTLTGVNTLGGYVQTASGAILAFCFTTNDVPDDAAARNWLDRATAVLAAS